MLRGGAGSRFDEQFASVLAALEDWKGRVERFAMERKQGLSEANRARVAAVRDACSALLSVGSAKAEDVWKLADEWEKQISK
ncbi:hypothetical protein QM565_28805 [Geitlerinema splendidum]|nr:hypothetical protein [Geitlerinema splendidum]